jgi:hypothetical protein
MTSIFQAGQPFNIVRTSSTTYQANDKDLVISSGDEVALPSPDQGATVLVRPAPSIDSVNITTSNGTIGNTGETFGIYGATEPIYLVGDGTDWYARSGGGKISAIPDSVVLNAVASSYDNASNQYLSNIGPNIPDANGNPSTTTISAPNGDDVTAVRYDDSNNEYSQVSSGVFPFDPSNTNSQAVVMTLVNRDGTSLSNSFGRYHDAATENDFILQVSGSVTDDPYGIATNGYSTNAQESSGSSVNTNMQTLAVVDDGTDFYLAQSSPSNKLINTNSDLTALSGLTIAAESDGTRHTPLDIVEISVMQNLQSNDLSTEMDRHTSAYGT